MPSQMIRTCGACGSADLTGVLRLGTSPPACSMGRVDAFTLQETHYPLEMLRCNICTLAQLSAIVDPETVFHRDYPYSSGNSKALHANFVELAASVRLKKNALVIDIGANDGTLLSKFVFDEHGNETLRRIAVEPTDQIKKIRDAGCYQSFFGLDVAKRIVAAHGNADVVTACNVLAHVHDIEDAMAGIRLLLGNSGQLIAENHDLSAIAEGGQWDTIYHEHLRYYDPHSFTELLGRHGLAADRIEAISTHGGSFRTYARPGAGLPWPAREYDWEGLRDRAKAARGELRWTLADIQDRGERCWGISAAARATTVIGYCGLQWEDIQAVVEVPGSDKIGHYMPGTDIPVIGEGALFAAQPEWAVLFAWHMADFIVPGLRKNGYKGRIIRPLPKPTVIA